MVMHAPMVMQHHANGHATSHSPIVMQHHTRQWSYNITPMVMQHHTRQWSCNITNWRWQVCSPPGTLACGDGRSVRLLMHLCMAAHITDWCWHVCSPVITRKHGHAHHYWYWQVCSPSFSLIHYHCKPICTNETSVLFDNYQSLA